MIRRFVPSLATEMHLTIRLLHVHSEVVRSDGGRTSTLEHDHQDTLPSSRSLVAHLPVDMMAKAREDSVDIAGDQPAKKVVFRTGLDCRYFAARVLRGLKSLLPHLGTDMLDLLAGSLALASQVKDRSLSLVISRDTLCTWGMHAFALLQPISTVRSANYSEFQGSYCLV